MMFRAHTTHARTANRRVANRRKKKSQHLLDVNIRSDRARAQRNQRIMLFGCKILLLFCIGVGLVYGCRAALNRLFFTNPAYTLTHIDVQIDGTLTREQVLRTLKLREGTNIFSVKLPAARQTLLEIPQVGEAEVQRMMPDTLKIAIHERRPVAWLVAQRSEVENLGVQNWMVDATGIALKSRALLPEYLRLPVIAGFPTEGLRSGKPVDSPEVSSALGLLSRASDALAGRFDIQMIDLSRGYCLDVMDREKTRVRFPMEGVDKQLDRLGLLLDYCETSGRKMATVNLMIQRNVPVTFVRVETIDLDPPKKTDPLPTGKKRKANNGKG